MCSKVWLIPILSLSLLGCELKLDDPAPPKNKGRLKSIRCLENIESEVTDYLEGKSSARRVKSLMVCTRQALDDFSYYGAGINEEGFYSRELAEFMNNNFLGKSKITDNLLKELMNIKLLMVGGDSSFITNEEFDRLRELTYILETEAIRNLPYVRMYRQLLSKDEAANLSLENLKAADTQLSVSISQFTNLLRSSQRSYSLSSLKALVSEVRKFLRWEEKDYKYDWNTDQLAELLFIFKRIVAGDSSRHRSIEVKDWDPLLNAIGKWYYVYLQYHYFLKGRSLHAPESFSSLGSIVDTSFKLLQSSVYIQDDKLIPTKLVLAFAEKAHEMGLFLPEVRFEESIAPVISYFIHDVFWDRTLPYDNRGIFLSTINQMEMEASKFLRAQRVLSDLNATKKGVFSLLSPGWNFKKALKTFFPRDMIYDEVTLLSDIRALSPLGENRLYIVPEHLAAKYDLKWSVAERTRLNVIQTLSRLLIKGFAKDSERSSQYLGLTAAEMENFYRVVKNLGEDLHLMDTRKLLTGHRIFQEANLFTWSGNGVPAEGDDLKAEESLMTHRESVEQLLVIFSTAVVDNKIYQSTLNYCQRLTEQELRKNGILKPYEYYQPELSGDFQVPMINKYCFVDRFAMESYKSYYNMPLLVDHLEGSGIAYRIQFIRALLKLVDHKCVKPQWVERGQLSSLTAILHYIEMLFSQYDRNVDGILDEAEVFSAFSRFANFIRPVVEDRNGGEPVTLKELKMSFAYITKYKKEPEGWLDKAPALLWQWYFDSDPDQFPPNVLPDTRLPKIRVSRRDLISILQLVQGKSTQAMRCN